MFFRILGRYDIFLRLLVLHACFWLVLHL
jgi:hypothetical protein